MAQRQDNRPPGPPTRPDRGVAVASQTAEPPTLDAFRTRDGVCLVIWCRHCRQLHYHGACGPMTGEGDGHRGAHCIDPGSPYRRTGYFVREVSRGRWLDGPWWIAAMVGSADTAGRARRARKKASA